MPTLRPFTEADLPEAGRLLAARHALHRRCVPRLDPAFEDAATAAEQVAALWAEPGASGSVALDDGAGGRVVGYLLGVARDARVWGDNVWVPSAGHAVEAGREEVARDLYAAAAAGWVADGRTEHYVLLPAGPAGGAALVDAWFRLAFGLQQVHAVREPLPAEPTSAPSGAAGSEVVVRRAERRDVPVLARLDLVLPAAHGASPVFSSGPVGTLEEAEAEWEESVDDPTFTTFVAEVPGAGPGTDGEVVGSAIGCALTLSTSHEGLARLPDAGFLGFAAVLPDARGRGAGRALGEAVLRWSGEAGYACCVTDWRAPNLLSSRAWVRLGFRDTFWRLHRSVGH